HTILGNAAESVTPALEGVFANRECNVQVQRRLPARRRVGHWIITCFPFAERGRQNDRSRRGCGSDSGEKIGTVPPGADGHIAQRRCGPKRKRSHLVHECPSAASIGQVSVPSAFNPSGLFGRTSFLTAPIATENCK